MYLGKLIMVVGVLKVSSLLIDSYEQYRAAWFKSILVYKVDGLLIRDEIVTTISTRATHAVKDMMWQLFHSCIIPYLLMMKI